MACVLAARLRQRRIKVRPNTYGRGKGTFGAGRIAEDPRLEIESRPRWRLVIFEGHSVSGLLQITCDEGSNYVTKFLKAFGKYD